MPHADIERTAPTAIRPCITRKIIDRRKIMNCVNPNVTRESSTETRFAARDGGRTELHPRRDQGMTRFTNTLLRRFLREPFAKLIGIDLDGKRSVVVDHIVSVLID